MASSSWQPAANAGVKKKGRGRFIVYLFTLSCILYVLKHTIFAPAPTKIQFKKFRHGRGAQPDRQKAVRKEFLHAWFGYKDHAWMADSLKPVSGGATNHYCGWSATLVDALDTLWVMDLKDEFDEAINATLSIDFKRVAVNCEISLLESTVRHLGGLLAAYDLSKDRRLLPKLVELGDILHGQFNTKNGMPCSKCKILSQGRRDYEPEHNVPLAEVGSYYLEFARLSQVTGDKKYLDLVLFLTNVLESHQNSSSIPGLWPERVDAAVIEGQADRFSTTFHTYSLGAGSDSAYEYLVKTHLLLGGMTGRYAGMWFKASMGIVQNLLFRAHIPQWETTRALFTGIASHYSDKSEYTLEPRAQHLACFAGGMFALSSKLFRNPLDLDLARELTQGCIWAYENSPAGIMPETLTLIPCPQLVGPQCAWNETLWRDAKPMRGAPPGILTSKNPRYLLRSQAIESVFVLYRVTGDEYYRDVAWKMFVSIIAQTRTPYGHASVANVLRPLAGQQQQQQQQQMQNRGAAVAKGNLKSSKQQQTQLDEMESFWLADTLKYFWLLFSESDRMSLDDWVFNAGAHPLRLEKKSRAF